MAEHQSMSMSKRFMCILHDQPKTCYLTMVEHQLQEKRFYSFRSFWVVFVSISFDKKIKSWQNYG
jgi:hypothetical protein